jgi:hypothetical protein
MCVCVCAFLDLHVAADSAPKAKTVVVHKAKGASLAARDDEDLIDSCSIRNEMTGGLESPACEILLDSGN